METNATASLHESEQVNGDVSAPSDDSALAVKDPTTILEVILPATIAAHVRNVLTRRGIVLDDFILDLLTRFVPGAASYLPDPEDLKSTSKVQTT